MFGEEDRWLRFVDSHDSEENAWAVRRVPLESRPPSVALYEGLALYHSGRLPFENLVETIEFNERIDRSMRARLLRSTFKVLGE